MDISLFLLTFNFGGTRKIGITQGKGDKVSNITILIHLYIHLPLQSATQTSSTHPLNTY